MNFFLILLIGETLKISIAIKYRYVIFIRVYSIKYNHYIAVRGERKGLIPLS